jgi:hypothetical protein
MVGLLMVYYWFFSLYNAPRVLVRKGQAYEAAAAPAYRYLLYSELLTPASTHIDMLCRRDLIIILLLDCLSR